MFAFGRGSAECPGGSLHPVCQCRLDVCMCNACGGVSLFVMSLLLAATRRCLPWSLAAGLVLRGGASASEQQRGGSALCSEAAAALAASAVHAALLWPGRALRLPKPFGSSGGDGSSTGCAGQQLVALCAPAVRTMTPGRCKAMRMPPLLPPPRLMSSCVATAADQAARGAVYSSVDASPGGGQVRGR